MKKNNKVNEVMENAEVSVEVKAKKQRKPRQSFADLILKRIDAKAKNVGMEEYFNIHETIKNALNELEKLIEAEKIKSKQEKITFKRLAKFSEADIRMYLSQINEVK